MDVGIDMSFLRISTPCGIFITHAGGPVYWVIESIRGKYAIQLNNAAGRPPFSYQRLEERPLAAGMFLGPAIVESGALIDGTNRGVCGFLVRQGIRWHIKVNTPKGKSERLPILPYSENPASHTEFHQLILRCKRSGADIKLPSVKGPVPLSTYHEQSFGSLRLVG